MSLLARVRRCLGGPGSGPAAFWLAEDSGLVLAVIERSDDEALLLDCAASAGPPLAGQLVAAGLLECALAAGATGLEHFVAVGGRHCRLLVDDEPPVRDESRLRVPVQGSAGLSVETSAGLVAEIHTRFAAAGMSLTAVDAEPCALMSLAAYLGCDPGAGPPTAASLDPLAGVALASSCQDRALALGRRLGGPVGLALARLRFVGDG